MLKSLCLLTVFLACTATSFAKALSAYIGTYTNGESQGIYLVGFDTETGELSLKGLAAETTDPSFVALHPNGKYLYAVNETSEGGLSAFKIDEESRNLTLINEQQSGGAHPCHLVVDETGTNLLVANYTGGNVSVTRIKSDGSLGKQTALIQHDGSSVNKNRQKEPHAHSINIDANNRYAIAADLGTDRLIVYDFVAKSGTLKAKSATQLKPGSGPRHFVFHPDGKHAYSINELLSTVTALDYKPRTGELSELQSITTLPRDFTGKSFTAEVRISPDGRFVYGSNRGHDSIAVFRVNDDFRLTLIQIEKIGGKTPRNFNLSPDGKFLLAAGQATNDIHVFGVDAKTGKLSKTAHTLKVPSPVCIRFAK